MLKTQLVKVWDVVEDDEYLKGVVVQTKPTIKNPWGGYVDVEVMWYDNTTYWVDSGDLFSEEEP
jgi:hypothetical protein